MDREDFEHFRTIGSASVKQMTDCAPKLSREQSNSPHDPLSCNLRAKAIFGFYRRDEAHDPEVFVAGLALVLADYPASVVDYAADPRTGVIKSFPMGLPNIGQIGQFLDDVQARQDRITRYASLPKAKPVIHDKPPVSEPNLFVPDISNRYAAMVKRADAEPERARFGSKVCTDGQPRNGVFVPLNWWEEPQAKTASSIGASARKVFERVCVEAGVDPAGGVSPALLANLKENSLDEDTDYGEAAQ